MRVHVRRQVCTGSTVCVGLAPRVFEIDPEDGKARVEDPHAAERFPARAIVLEMDEE